MTNPAPAERARALALQSRIERADAFASALAPTLQGFIRLGMSYRAMAAELERRGVKAPRGGDNWTAKSVARLIARLKPKAAADALSWHILTMPLGTRIAIEGAEIATIRREIKARASDPGNYTVRANKGGVTVWYGKPLVGMRG